jgi:CheY-like chemotaxis protein
MPHELACRVLVVDDEPTIRALLASQLEAAGFETEQAGDGLDGLVKLREKLPHVIISDLEMPRMAGSEFVSVVRRRFPQIPVFIHSGVRPNGTQQVTPDVWLQKGSTKFAALLEAVREWTQNPPRRSGTPPAFDTPLQARQIGGGYVVLTCTDCLRTLTIRSEPEMKAVERTACCDYCQARLRFLVESSAPD